MTLAPSVWPLPFGVSIRTDYSPDHNYSLPRSQTQCWPVQLNSYQQVIIAAIHNGWISSQAWTLRGWLSIDPGGSNILSSVYGICQNVHLTFSGNTWNFHTVEVKSNTLEKADISFIIDPNQIYYFNIQNTSNSDESYYSRFTFIGKDTRIVL